MGGAVNKVFQVAQAVASPVTAAGMEVGKRLVNEEDISPRGVALAQIKSGVSLAKEGAGEAVNVGRDVGLLSQKPNIQNIGEDSPADTAEADKVARARAKRQAQVDILTDRPGRGGTILTDNYSYQV